MSNEAKPKLDVVVNGAKVIATVIGGNDAPVFELHGGDTRSLVVDLRSIAERFECAEIDVTGNDLLAEALLPPATEAPEA